MAHVIALDLAPRQRLDIGEGKCAPDAAAGKAIGLAASEGEASAIRSKPVADILGKYVGPLAIGGSAFAIVLGNDRIDQRIEMQGEGHIVVGALHRSVTIPAFAKPERLDFIEIFFRQRAVEIDTGAC
ncbi:hypothetical protein D3C73_793310 [compost metagenome]